MCLRITSQNILRGDKFLPAGNTFTTPVVIKNNNAGSNERRFASHLSYSY